MSLRARPATVGLSQVHHRDPVARRLSGIIASLDTPAKSDPVEAAEAQDDATADPFRMLAESIPQLVWMAEPGGDIFWYNRRWYDYTGTTLEQMAGWGWKAVHDPAMLDAVTVRWSAALASGEPFEMEFPIRRHDGVFRWFLTRVMPVRGADGAVARWFGTNTDIDDQRRAAQRARFLAEASVVLGTGGDIEQTLTDLARLLVPAMADWYAVDELGADGALHRLAVAHTDPARIDLAWELWRRYPTHPDDAPVLRTGVAELYADLPDRLLVASARDPDHLRMIRELGLRSAIAVPLKARDRTFGMLTLVTAESGRTYDRADVAFAEDLGLRAAAAIENARLSAARDAAEAKLREEREALATLNRVNSMLSGELDQEKLVQALTDAATELSGAQFGAFFYTVVNASGESFMLYTLTGMPRDRFAKFPMPRNTAVFGPTFRGEGVVRVDDVTLDPRYGKNTPYFGMPPGHPPVRSYLAVSVTSHSGTVIGGLFFGHARAGVFTERAERLVVGLAAQAAVAMDNARLYREAQDTSREHERLITALERSNRELDQFAYVASHDLKAPLRGIANLSQWLEDDLADRMTPEAREQMAMLRGRVHRLEALIDGILSYSRAGRVQEKAEAVDVGRLLDECVELLSPTPTARVEIVRPMPTVVSERVPLQQVFLNLIGNALKYAQRPDARVRVTAREVPPGWEFAVEDNGPGIASEYQKRIWGIFQTLESRDKVEGTGIGLSVVKKIVESRGGRAWVVSGEGRGATFCFTWPGHPREANE